MNSSVDYNVGKCIVGITIPNVSRLRKILKSFGEKWKFRVPSDLWKKIVNSLVDFNVGKCIVGITIPSFKPK